MLHRKDRTKACVFTRILLCSVFIVLFFALTIDGIADDLLTARVGKIIDGDTIRVQYKAQNILVRLWGIDTPEYHQAYSKVAKKYTEQLVNNSLVRLEEKDWDDYGRMVAIVTMKDDRCLNEELLKAGLAWVHIYYCKEAICDQWNEYEKIARQKRIGLWRDKSPVPPWIHKRKRYR
ncbi:MAG: thermonuclease family protein [Thermodesulfobacteriota bacterium]|nr:thermonuclease family protein [Thermodesulfobacteriota bacterium]